MILFSHFPIAGKSTIVCTMESKPSTDRESSKLLGVMSLKLSLWARVEIIRSETRIVCISEDTILHALARVFWIDRQTKHYEAPAATRHISTFEIFFIKNRLTYSLKCYNLKDLLHWYVSALLGAISIGSDVGRRAAMPLEIDAEAER